MLTPHQSGFRPNDSCIYQLLSIVHSIYTDFDHNPSLEVPGNFLDISKAFDKVWHEGLLYKLESIGISGNLLNLFRSFLNDRCQRVVINSQHSEWVPQGSILGPLLFLIYINDLPDNLNSLVKLFADDTSLFSMVHDPSPSAKILNYDLSRISQWAHRRKMLFNLDIIQQAPVAQATSQKHLGMHLDEKLNFNYHVKDKTAKANKGIGLRQSLLTI